MELLHETNTGFTGTPGRLQVRQWTPGERAAFPDLTGNALRMRLDEAAATPGDGLQCLPATPGLAPRLEGSGGSDVRSVAGPARGGAGARAHDTHPPHALSLKALAEKARAARCRPREGTPPKA